MRRYRRDSRWRWCGAFTREETGGVQSATMPSTPISPVPAQIEQGHSPVPLHAPQSSTIRSGASIPVTAYEPAPSQARHGTRPSKQCLHSCVTANSQQRRSIGRVVVKTASHHNGESLSVRIPDEMDIQEPTFSAFLVLQLQHGSGFFSGTAAAVLVSLLRRPRQSHVRGRRARRQNRSLRLPGVLAPVAVCAIDSARTDCLPALPHTRLINPPDA